MIGTFWLFVFALIGFGITIALGRWWLIALGYLIAGATWVLHDSTRPFLDVPVGYMIRRGTLLLGFVWPYVASLAAVKRWKALRSSERFRVFREGARELGTFTSLASALAAAKEAAANLNERIFVLDNARFYWDLMMQQWEHLLYVVEPSGTVERADRAQLAQ